MNALGWVLFVLWLVEGPVSAVVSVANLSEARLALAQTAADHEASAIDIAIARRHVRRELLRLIVSIVFILVGFYGILALLSIISPTSGVALLVLLDLAQGLTIFNSVSDRNLRREVRDIMRRSGVR